VQKEFGRYRILRHLATGGMGEVYLAEAMGAAGFAKRIVIKTLRADLAADADLVRQFVAEGQVLEALDHPNIAQILDLGLFDDTYFLAMEMVEGFDLRALRRAMAAGQEKPWLREASVLYIASCVARALDHAQTRRGPDGKPLAIVHHDVTPSNIMVRGDGHVKLVDFGVARSALMSRLTPGALRGKLPYLSPEHAHHDTVDGRADLFSLGLCLYEFATGKRALEVGEPESLDDAYARLPAKLDALTEAGALSADGMLLLRSLLHEDRERRPKSAGEVGDRAEQLLVSLGEPSPARVLASELEPAFAVLEAQARSFDQTLAQLIGFGESHEPQTFSGATASLPGLEAVHIAASARPAQAPGLTLRPPRPRRLRHIAVGLFALLAVVLLWRRAMPGRVIQPEVPRRAPAVADPQPAAAETLLPTPAPAVAIAAAPQPQPEPAAEPQAPTPSEEPQLPAHPPSGRHAKEKADSTALVQFLVLPADCKVWVDGKRSRAQKGNRFEITVSATTAHRIEVEDPSSHKQRVVEIDRLAPGEVRTLPGFYFGEDLP